MTMIIDVPGLDPAYRLYQCDSGRYIRVWVNMRLDTATNSSYYREYIFRAEHADENGLPLGLVMSDYVVSYALSETDMTAYSQASELPAVGEDGQLVETSGRLYEWYEGAWFDRGPIPVGASPGLAETLALFDRTARELITTSDRAFTRMESDAEIVAVLGQDVSASSI